MRSVLGEFAKVPLALDVIFKLPYLLLQLRDAGLEFVILVK